MCSFTTATAKCPVRGEGKGNIGKKKKVDTCSNDTAGTLLKSPQALQDWPRSSRRGIQTIPHGMKFVRETATIAIAFLAAEQGPAVMAFK